jgi:hypothetical protein
MITSFRIGAYSIRKARMGSMAAARRAGNHEAIAATAHKNPAAAR